MSIPRSTAWGLLSQRAGPTVVLAQMSYGPEGDSDKLYIGSDLVTLEDNDYLPLIAAMPHRFQEVDFWTREFSISDLSLEILNMPFHGDTRFSDLFDERGAGNDRGFENRQADVRLWKPGITTWDDCFELFPAGLTRKPVTQGSIAVVEVQDHTFLTLQNVQLDRFTDSDAADTDQGLPEISQGKIKPPIYGDHTFPKANDSKSLDTASSINNMSPMIYLGVASDGRHHWFVSRRKADEIIISGTQAQIWGFDRTLNRLVRLANDGGTDIVVEQNTSAGCIISHLATPQFIDYFYGKGTVTTDHLGDEITEFVNVSRIIDKSFVTASRGSLNPDTLNLDFSRITVPFGEWENQNLADSAILEIVLNWYGEATFAGGADGTKYVIQFAHIGGAAANGTEPDTGGIYPDARMEDASNEATLADIAKSIQFNLIATGNYDADDQVLLDIYEMYKAVRYEPGELLPLLFAGKGEEVGPDIGTNRAVVDGYDEAHADQGNSANLAENLATLVELTLRNDAGLGDSRLNLNSLNTASNDVPGLVGAPAFLEQPNTYLQALFNLVQQYRGFLWWTPSGELFLKILEDDYTAADRVIDGSLITNLKYGRTDINRLYTAVQMLYNEINGANLLETPLVEDATAQTRYNVTQGQTLLKHPAHGYNLNGAASAVSTGNYFLANQKNIHNTVGVQLPIMFNHLDIGDLVGFENLPENLRGEDLSTSYTIAGQTFRPYFLINSVDRSDELMFEAFQVIKLD